MTIYVIEDNSQILSGVVKTLHELGHNVLWMKPPTGDLFENCKEQIKQVCINMTIDLILLDQKLWDLLNGESFIKTIKEYGVPFVGFSGSSINNDSLKNAGAIGSIEKRTTGVNLDVEYFIQEFTKVVEKLKTD